MLSLLLVSLTGKKLMKPYNWRLKKKKKALKKAYDAILIKNTHYDAIVTKNAH